MSHEQIVEHHYEHPTSVEQIDHNELRRRRIAGIAFHADNPNRPAVMKARDAQNVQNAAFEQMTGEFPRVEAHVTYDAGSNGPVTVNQKMN